MTPELVHSPSDPETRPAVFPYGRVDEDSQWPATPGTDDCARCGAETINVHGVLDCPECEWSDR